MGKSSVEEMMIYFKYIGGLSIIIVSDGGWYEYGLILMSIICDNK
jgi:hypothetical protein